MHITYSRSSTGTLQNPRHDCPDMTCYPQKPVFIGYTLLRVVTYDSLDRFITINHVKLFKFLRIEKLPIIWVHFIFTMVKLWNNFVWCHWLKPTVNFTASYWTLVEWWWQDYQGSDDTLGNIMCSGLWFALKRKPVYLKVTHISSEI